MKTATADEVQEIALVQLDPHPRNTHGKLTADHPKVQELKASIQATRQNEPCLVRPKENGRFEILSGHIRTFAQELLGAETVPCLVREVDDEQALTILITSNEKEPVDPLLEADAIAELMKTKEGGLKAVAETLGKTVRYVAARANLCTLSKKVRALYTNGKIAHWTTSMLEELARLTPEVQDELATNKPQNYPLETIRDEDHLSRVLGDCFRELGKAMWKLDDAALEPAAGPCTTCPKTSLRCPGLFDEGDLDPADPKSIKKAICRDKACWDRKSMTHVEQRLDELKDANPDATVVKRSYRADSIPKGVRAVESYEAHDAKKGDKGAKQAILLTDSGPKLGYVKIEKGASSPAAKAEKKKPAAEQDPKKRLAESKEQIGKRRRAFVVDAIRAKIEKLDKTPAGLTKGGAVLGLVAAYKLEHPEGLYRYANPKGRKKVFDACAGSMASFADEAWPRLQNSIAETLKRYNPENLDDEHAAATWIAGVVGIDVEKLVAAALKEIPDPKFWASLDAVPTAIATAVEPGMCRGCGCTHDKACAGGCSWVEKPDVNALQKKDKRGRWLSLGLCSSCSGVQPEGKKASKKKAKK